MVHPFVGVNYGKIKPLGLSILVLGESSYNGKRGERLHYAWNKRIIRCLFDRQPGDSYRDNTITKAAGVFYGKGLSFQERRNFWRTSAFANLLQTDLGKPGQPKKDWEWRLGAKAFRKYLNHLRPQFVLALGKDLWSNLPRQDRRKYRSIRVGLEARPCYLYPNGVGYSVVVGIDHPASYGWNYEKWTPWVKAAVSTATKFQLRYSQSTSTRCS